MNEKPSKAAEGLSFGFCRVNEVVLHDVPGPETLLEWLRDTASCVDVRQGCDTGHCGSCAVLVNGVPVKSCSMLAREAEGHDVYTLSGLALLECPEAQAVMKAAEQIQPFQCGYCVSPFLLAAIQLLHETPAPTEVQVREALIGLLCRCTGYQSIVDMVLQAAQLLESARNDERIDLDRSGLHGGSREED